MKKYTKYLDNSTTTYKDELNDDCNKYSKVTLR